MQCVGTDVQGSKTYYVPKALQPDNPACVGVLLTHAEAQDLTASASQLADLYSPIAPAQFWETASGAASYVLIAFLVAYFVGVLVRSVE